MTALCCACHSSTIAALIYIIVVSNMHGQKVDTTTCRLPHVDLHAVVIDEQRQPFIRPRVPHKVATESKSSRLSRSWDEMSEQIRRQRKDNG